METTYISEDSYLSLISYHRLHARGASVVRKKANDTDYINRRCLLLPVKSLKSPAHK